MSSEFHDAEWAAQQFVIDGKFSHIDRVDSGLINSTYVAYFTSQHGVVRYIIQRINDHVFPDPLQVMHNVELIIDHLASSSDQSSPERQLTLFRTKGGEPYYRAEDGGLWRCYSFIEGCCTYETVENAEQAYEAARAFGEFQHQLSELPLAQLEETIPDFHHTPKRYQNMLDSAQSDPLGRVAEIQEELNFIEQRRSILSRLIDLRDAGDLPLRVTHNDTKLSNVMMDERSGKAVCVIDLDTVMPGLSLYDFGDLVRTSVHDSEEDSEDAVEVRVDFFRAIVDGYLTSCQCLNTEEINQLVFSARLITLELAIRFLNDYIDGDHYFRTDYAGQNLRRARMQLQLVSALESCEDEMEAYVRSWHANKDHFIR